MNKFYTVCFYTVRESHAGCKSTRTHHMLRGNVIDLPLWAIKSNHISRNDMLELGKRSM